MKRTLARTTALLLLSFMAGCSSLKEDLGMGRSQPDEFAVIDRPPLSMPPDFSLRPPRPGATGPHEVDTKQQASAALFTGATSGATTNFTTSSAVDPSAAETQLLNAVGAEKAEPNIREIVDRETSQKVVTDDHMVKALLSWVRDSSSDTQSATVDASAEADRVKQALQKGEPVNQGATPVIEKEKSGWLGL